MWDLPRSGTEPLSSALADGFFTTEPPGKPREISFSLNNFIFFLFAMSHRTWDLSSPVSVLVTQSCPTLCNPIDCTAHQTPLSKELSEQEYWSGLPFPSPRDLPDPGIEPGFPALKVDSLLSKPPGKPCEIRGIL